MKRILLVAMMVLFAGATIMAQKTISGTVTDNTGEALIGANIYLAEDPSVGTITDFDGYYELSIPADAVTLEISFTGYETQRIALGSDDVYDIVMLEGIQLSEAVVTALGISREHKSLGYSAQEVGGEQLAASRAANPLNALSGNVAGVSISTPSSSLGGSTRILLRGVTSLTGENRPLIVVDGIPLANNNVNSTNTQRGAGGRDYGDTAFDINPDDIENISVLKGGPAAALYGSRGVNGVIMITTKSAKKGRDEIVFNTAVAFDQISVFPKLQTRYGGGYGNDFDVVEINGKEYNVPGYEWDASWGPELDGREVLAWYNVVPEFEDVYLKTTPWSPSANDFNTFFRTGVTYTNSISLAKSYENTSARLSVSNVAQTGVAPNSNLNRTTASLGLENKFSDRFTVSGDITYVRTDGYNRPESGYGDLSIGQAYYQWGQRQLDFSKLEQYWKINDVTQATWNRSSVDNGFPAFHNNPYWNMYMNTSQDLRNRFYGNVQAKYEILDGLYAIGSVYGDNYSYNIQSHVAVGSWSQSEFATNTWDYTEMNYEGRLHYGKDLGFVSLNAFAGANRRNASMTAISGSTNGGLIVPLVYNLGNSMEQPSTSNSYSQRRVNSVFGSLSLGFADMFYLDLTGRNDWSSTLPSDHNSYFYPSVTGTFVFSELMHDVSWLSFGKLRAGWAQIYNDADPYLLRNVFSSGSLAPNFLGLPTFTNGSTMRNPNLKPEATTTWEVGIEAALFRSRLMIDVTYYQKVTKDLIMPVQTTPATGFGSMTLNAGTMENNGIEALVTVVPVRNRNFEWALTWNFAKNNNVVTDLYGDLDALVLTNAPFKVQLAAMKGEKYGQLRGTDYVYDDQGRRVVSDDGSHFLTTDIESLGSVMPDFNTGIRNTFTYKNLSLSALIDIQKGGKYFSVSHMFGHYSGLFAATAENNVREDGVLVEGVVTGTVVKDETAEKGYRVENVQEFSGRVDAIDHFEDYYFGPAARSIFNADYIKLRDLTLSYAFPTSNLGPLSGLEISAFARNLFVWGLDNPDFDPEMMMSGSGNIQGMEGGNLPPTRTYGLNLRLKF